MTGRIAELVESSSLATMRAYLEKLPTWCSATPSAAGHQVTADNPLNQGRCLSCRQFVRRDEHGRWAVST